MSRVATAPSKQERVKETQSHLKQWMRNKINRNMARNPFQRREIEARNIRTVSQDAKFIKKPQEPPDPFKAHLALAHRAQPDGVSVLNLPKQPFGMHKTYNETAAFTQTHFVQRSEELSSQKAKQLDEVIRQFRLCAKKDNSKMFRALTQGMARRRGGSLDSGKPECDEFQTSTGRLWCPREKYVEAAYNEQKKKYQGVNLSQPSELIEDLLEKLGKTRTKSKADPFPRLYFSGLREWRSTEMSDRLCSKYAALFQASNRLRHRRFALQSTL